MRWHAYLLAGAALVALAFSEPAKAGENASSAFGGEVWNFNDPSTNSVALSTALGVRQAEAGQVPGSTVNNLSLSSTTNIANQNNVGVQAADSMVQLNVVSSQALGSNKQSAQAQANTNQSGNNPVTTKQ